MTREEREKAKWVKERRTLESLPGIRGAAKVVLLKIHSLGRCFMRQETMAAEIGVHPVTVCRSLKRLERDGIIAGQRQGQGEASAWWIDWDGVERYIQPGLFDAERPPKKPLAERQTAKSRFNKLLSLDLAVCNSPILIKEGENNLSPTPSSSVPGERREQAAFDLVRHFYDRKDVPLPNPERRERDALALVERIHRHGLAVVRHAVETMDVSREYLFGSTWQLDKAIKRVKARVNRPAVPAVVRAEVKTPDESDEAWERLSEEERASWVSEAKRQYRFLEGMPDDNPFVVGAAVKLKGSHLEPESSYR